MSVASSGEVCLGPPKGVVPTSLLSLGSLELLGDLVFGSLLPERSIWGLFGERVSESRSSELGLY